ncbi:MAG: ABC transporter permease [Firmicutes bacterium]|nr:ABC transporter permease [Bacillota bacterium]
MDQVRIRQVQTSSVTKFLRGYGLFIGLGILFTLFSVLSRYFLTVNNLFNVGRQIAVTSIIAFGMTFIITAGQIDLSVGSGVALTGLLTAVLVSRTALPAYIWPWVIIGVGVGMGLLHGFFVAKQKIPAFIVTLGTMGIIRGIGFFMTKGYPIYIESKGFRELARGDLLGIPTPIVIMIVLWCICEFVFTQTRLGKYIQVVGENSEVARLSGIEVDKILYKVFIIGGVLTAIGGILMASRLGTGSPAVGEGLELEVIAAVILGGTSLFGGEGTLIGTIMGAIFIGMLVNGMILLNVSPYAQMVARGIVVLGAVWLNTSEHRRLR